MHSEDYMLSQDVRLSVWLSVCLSHAGYTISNFSPGSHSKRYRYVNTPTGTLLTGASNKMSMNRDFWPIFRFISKTIQYGLSYYGTRIGNRTHAFKWYRFQWPWMTLNPGFKVTLLFDAEYLRNGTRHRHSYNGILIVIGTYTRPT